MGHLPDLFDAFDGIANLSVSALHSTNLKLALNTPLAFSYMDSNELSGPLPPSLMSAPSLMAVHLTNNSFIGSLQFTAASNLTQLHAARNAFSTVNLNASELLQTLVMDDNAMMSDQFPTFGSHFSHLQVFSAARCNFSGPAFNLSLLPSLVRLSVLLLFSHRWSADQVVRDTTAGTCNAMRSLDPFQIRRAS